MSLLNNDLDSTMRTAFSSGILKMSSKGVNSISNLWQFLMSSLAQSKVFLIVMEYSFSLGCARFSIPCRLSLGELLAVKLKKRGSICEKQYRWLR